MGLNVPVHALIYRAHLRVMKDKWHWGETERKPAKMRLTINPFEQQ